MLTVCQQQILHEIFTTLSVCLPRLLQFRNSPTQSQMMHAKQKQKQEEAWIKLLTSMHCRRVISKHATLFKTFNTLVATSSKFDGRIAEA